MGDWDENSQFFHSILERKRRKNAVRGAMMDGVWLSNPSEVKTTFCNHFEVKFRRFKAAKITQKSPNMQSLDESERVYLEEWFLDEEIKDAVW